MLQDLYTLNIISHLPESKGKLLKKYNLDQIDTVGAYGNEPFEVVFKNNTFSRVQVKLSIDGTDVLTGKLADTTPQGEMWVVEGYGTLSLKAWPETNKGGAQFIFTSADKSVAVHTHGNLSSRGVIAAAVFVEGYVAPMITYDWYSSSDNGFGGGWGYGFGTKSSDNAGNYYNNYLNRTFCDTIVGNCSDAKSVDSINYLNSTSQDLQSLAAVGAGERIDQTIQKTSGLYQPIFSRIVKVKYMWWDDLVAKAKASNVYPNPESGFPGDEIKMMSIGSTPRIGSKWTPPLMPRSEITRF